MDLNASPLPEGNEQSHEEFVSDVPQWSESVQIMHRERNERCSQLKRKNPDEGPKSFSQASRNEHMHQNRSSAYGRVKQLPEGWLDCPSHGQPIEYIIPSKVPLDESYNHLVEPCKRYSSRQVISAQRRSGRELGLVIDLTNTTRYYSPSEWTSHGIKHVKIPCKGRDAVPDNESVNTFVYVVMRFLSRHKHSKKYILVHCTHGHNRTGFMIIHFLMRSWPMHVAEALDKFAGKRPPGIYKKDYILELYTFYRFTAPNNFICPSSPEWKRSSVLDLNGVAVPDKDDGDNTAALLHEHVESKLITDDDILGDPIPCDQQDEMRNICYQLLDLTPSGRGNAQFPGSHPVSLNRENLELLRQRYYYATWKADGTRYMMLITPHGCYLIDRKFCFRRIQMRFPMKNLSEGFHNFTLLDGEMVIDKDDSKLRRRYLVYDLVALGRRSITKLPFSERWKLIDEEIIQPRNNEKREFACKGKSNPIYIYDMEPFGVRRKNFWLLSTIQKLLERIPMFGHKTDGLIFQGWDDPYVPRTYEGLLKWKYPEMNSVDFLFEVGNENHQLLFLYERGKKKLMHGAQVIFEGEVDISFLSGKIIECSWKAEAGSWQCMRIRADKATPNDINTYIKVMRSINDNITEVVLLKEIKEIVLLPMYAERIADAEAQEKQKQKQKHSSRIGQQKHSVNNRG